MSPSNQDVAIPIIDIREPCLEVAKQVLEAASTHGFLFIKNDHGIISSDDIADMFALSREFFSQPKEKKSEYAIHSPKAGGLNRGWVSLQGESLDPEGQKQGDPKEAFNIAPPQPTLQPLPSPLCTRIPLITSFQTACHTLCTTLLTLLAISLSLPDPSYFSTRHDQTRGPSGTIFRTLYYPSTIRPADGLSIRAGAHSDYGSLTLLFRLPGQAGLEILTASGEWAPVPVNPSPETCATPPILVNIGDLLSFWTNGMLKSTVHRVGFTASASSEEQERYSMAYFCHPLDEVELSAVPSPVIEAFGAKGADELEAQRSKVGWKVKDGVLTAKEHLDRRLNVTYGLGK